ARGRNFKGFLHHISKGKSYQKNILKLRVKKKLVQVLEHEQVKAIIDACHTKRDKLLIMLMYEGGLRIGEVLYLRIEDMYTWDNLINIRSTNNNEKEGYI